MSDSMTDSTEPAPPKVSVIIPCHNAARWLWEQLDALSRQKVPCAWEVIVVDNRSTDLSAQVARSFQHRFSSLRVLAAHESRGPAYARNFGARQARGEYFLFFDADDVVGDGCVAAMLHALEEHRFVAAAHDHKRLNPEWTYNDGGERRKPGGPYELFLPYAGGGTIGIARNVFFSVGGFDETMARAGLEDCDFCWRVQLAGFPLKQAEGAVVHYRRRATMRSLFSQEMGFGADMMLLIRKYRQKGYDVHSKTWKGVALECVKMALRLPRAIQNKARFARWLAGLAFRFGMISGSFAALPVSATKGQPAAPTVAASSVDPAV